ncbi:MAG: hypothetical protein ACRELA_17255 [Candidatus Rokuibacteriota bacterium]
MRSVLDLLLLAAVVGLFLTSVQAFLSFRFRRAQRRGEERAYVAVADPWLPVVIMLTGAALITLLRLVQ